MKLSLFVSAFLLIHATSAWADTKTMTPNVAALATQQVELLKNREQQATLELARIDIEHANPETLSKTNLDIEIAKSNLQGINIELSESEQTICGIEKTLAETQDQLNALRVFGLKNAKSSVTDIHRLEQDLIDQNSQLALERSHFSYLQQLQLLSQDTLKITLEKHAKIELFLKSKALLDIKSEQKKYETSFQSQQAIWLKRLNDLYATLAMLERNKQNSSQNYSAINIDIFYANENVNALYLQMLVMRYEEQIQQLKILAQHGAPISLLNKTSDRASVLTKQFSSLNGLLSARISIFEKQKILEVNNLASVGDLARLEDQYKTTLANLDRLEQTLSDFQVSLDQMIKKELSQRQGLWGMGSKTWIDLYSQTLLVPTLTLQIVKNLLREVYASLQSIQPIGWAGLFFLECAWILLFFSLHRFLSRLLSRMPDHVASHISLQWLSIKLVHRHLLGIAVLGNIILLLDACHISQQNFNFILYIGIVWLTFRAILTIARVCLLENIHDRRGLDARLYHRLRWALLLGGIVTASTVLLHQLPLTEVQDFLYRLFLLFLSIVSLFLLRSRELFSGLILPHIDEHRLYLRKIVRLLTTLVPLVLLVNSVIGFFGFINFVLSVYWYEGIFLVVLAGYLLIRGLLNDALDFFSQHLIRYVNNGWLWTEAFLKPIDKITQVLIFFCAWAILFYLYGWDKQSVVIIHLDQLLHYPLFTLFHTNITPMSFIEFFIIGAVLSWAARWTRELVYRFLLSRTKDLGLRNSIAILSQYTVIIVGIFIGLRILGIDFRALTFIATGFAVGVGLGLRDLFNNFACGFLLLLERPLRVGDTVSISGEEGEVIHIGGRAVTILTWDNMELVVPNAEIFAKTFINWTKRDSIVRSIIAIKVNREDDPHTIRDIIHQTLAAHPEVLSDPVPEVLLKEIDNDLIEIEVRYHVNVRKIKSRISVRSSVLLAIWDAFKANHIHPPYPHQIYIDKE